MAKSEKDILVKLAHKRTELAQERTTLSYLRTSTALILFGLAFLGFGQGDSLYFNSGVISVVIGVFFLIIALGRYYKHSNEIKYITKLIRPRKR